MYTQDAVNEYGPQSTSTSRISEILNLAHGVDAAAPSSHVRIPANGAEPACMAMTSLMLAAPRGPLERLFNRSVHRALSAEQLSRDVLRRDHHTGDLQRTPGCGANGIISCK